MFGARARDATGLFRWVYVCRSTMLHGTVGHVAAGGGRQQAVDTVC